MGEGMSLIGEDVTNKFFTEKTAIQVSLEKRKYKDEYEYIWHIYNYGVLIANEYSEAAVWKCFRESNYRYLKEEK